MSATRQPRFVLLLNGTAATWPMSAEVVSNNYSEASRFNISLAVDQPTATELMTQAQITVEVKASLYGESPFTLVYGLADVVEVDFLSLHCTITGRDLAALMLDTPVQQPFSNMTSSQVLNMFVSEHAAQGLKGAITTTSGFVGRFYGTDYSETLFGDLYRPTNEWNMALMLAQGEGFDLRLGGPDANGKMLDAQTLYFGPAPAASSKPYTLNVSYGPPITSNVEALQLTRSLTLAKDVQVSVISWNSLESRPITAKLSASNVKAPKGGYGPQQHYVFRMPGDATPAQAQAYAQMKLKQVTSFEKVLLVKMPGELTITPAVQVALSGTGTQADQTYFVDEITRTIAFAGGFTQSMRLKNHSPYNVALVS